MDVRVVVAVVVVVVMVILVVGGTNDEWCCNACGWWHGTVAGPDLTHQLGDRWLPVF